MALCSLKIHQLVGKALNKREVQKQSEYWKRVVSMRLTFSRCQLTETITAAQSYVNKLKVVRPIWTVATETINLWASGMYAHAEINLPTDEQNLRLYSDHYVELIQTMVLKPTYWGLLFEGHVCGSRTRLLAISPERLTIDPRRISAITPLPIFRLVQCDIVKYIDQSVRNAKQHWCWWSWKYMKRFLRTPRPTYSPWFEVCLKDVVDD